MKIIQSLFTALLLINLSVSAQNTDSSLRSQVVYSSSVVDYVADYKLGGELLSKLMMDNMQIPDSASEMKVGGKVSLQFTISTSGTLEDVQATNEALNHRLEAEAIRLLMLSDSNWYPAIWNDEAVNSYRTMNVYFPDYNDDTLSMFAASVMPDIVTGYSGIRHFLMENVYYPDEAIEAEVSGTVILRFVVCKDGSICKIETISSEIGHGLEEEAIRVVELTNGLWTPAQLNGMPVNMQFQLPIKFSLY